MATPPQIGDRDGFFAEARAQEKCAVTGERRHDDHPHHVVYERQCLEVGGPAYDRRNALRVGVNAHANHHTAARRIRTVELLDRNIDYAFYLLGPRALTYLRRYYDDITEPDPRLARIEFELPADA